MKNFLVNTLNFIKKYLTIFIILLIFLFLFICDTTHTKTGSMIIDNLKSIATSFTPTTDLFDDGSEVSFVSYFFGMKLPTRKVKAEFYYPTNKPNLSTNTEFLSYSFDGLVNSVANGVVKSVGYTQNNEKYLEIEHAEGYVSRYIGIKSLGVITGENVGAGNPIGVVDSKSSVKIYIHQNNNLIKINKIEWKD